MKQLVTTVALTVASVAVMTQAAWAGSAWK